MKQRREFRQDAYDAARCLVNVGREGLADVVLCFDYRIVSGGETNGANAFNVVFFTLTARQIVDGVEKNELPLE